MRTLLVATLALTATCATPAAAQTAPPDKLDQLFPGTARTLATTPESKLGATEQLLLQGKLWGAAIDSSRPGCASCGPSGLAFHFFRLPDKMLARVFYQRGQGFYDAYLKGQRYPGDLQLDHAYYHNVKVGSSGNVYLLTSYYTYDCQASLAAEVNCTRTYTDGWVDKLVLRRLPYNTTDQRIP